MSITINDACRSSVIDSLVTAFGAVGSTGDYKNGLMLIPGTIPADAAAWDALSSTIQHGNNNLLYIPLDTPASDISNNGDGRIKFALSIPGKVNAVADGVVGYIQVSGTYRNVAIYYPYPVTFTPTYAFVLSVGTFGSGADLEIDTTTIINGQEYASTDVFFTFPKSF